MAYVKIRRCITTGIPSATVMRKSDIETSLVTSSSAIAERPRCEGGGSEGG